MRPSMDSGSVETRKAEARKMIYDVLDQDRQVFIGEVFVNTGITPQEISEKFIINETRMITDADKDGYGYNVEARVRLVRK